MMMLRRMVGAAAVAAAVCAFAEKPMTEGAELGVQTMDFEAAKALAKKEGKPLFLTFTGSDWCGWCKLMDKNVFSKKEWKEYAKKNLVLVWIDSPQNKALVPEKFVPQNKKLMEEYGVSGFPTYIILGDKLNKLGELGADRDIGPETFIARIEDTLIKQRLDKLLSAKDLADYQDRVTEREKLEEEFEAWLEKVNRQGDDYQKRIKEAGEKEKKYLDMAKARSKKAK